MMGDGGSTQGHKRRSDEDDDDLWRPQGNPFLAFFHSCYSA